MGLNIKTGYPRTLITFLRCKQCGWEWLPRSTSLPKRCPGCKRAHWEREPSRRWKAHVPKTFSSRKNPKIPR
jgi:hypothetical protein